MSNSNHQRRRTDGFRKIKKVPSDVQQHRKGKVVDVIDFDGYEAQSINHATHIVTGVDISRLM